jgi:hypothetical protein
MPAQIENALFCADYDATFEVEGSGMEPYTVEWNADEMAGASCTCMAYRFAKGPDKTCKHIDKVFKQGCFWNPQWYEGGTRELRPVEYHGDIIEDEHCPACGGPVIAVRIAV